MNKLEREVGNKRGQQNTYDKRAEKHMGGGGVVGGLNGHR